MDTMEELNYAVAFGENLVGLLEKTGMSQADLSRELDLSRSTINKYCKGLALPSPRTIVRMSEAMGVSTDVLLLKKDAEAEGASAKALIEDKIGDISAPQLKAIATLLKGLSGK